MAEDKTPTYDDIVWQLLVENRGAVPRNCDFCGLPYIKGERWPVPEQERAWSCNECSPTNQGKQSPLKNFQR
jgi:hypothetical protein